MATLAPLFFSGSFFILAGNKYNYKFSDEFEFQLDPTSDCELAALECLKNHYFVLWPL